MNYVLFGLPASDLNAARTAVEAKLGIRMDPHESMYLGGDYFRFGRTEGEHFILQSNYNDFEQQLTEPSFPQYAFLLYANETTRAEEITGSMRGVAYVLSSRNG